MYRAPGFLRRRIEDRVVKKFVVLIFLVFVGYYLYQGPLAPYIDAGEFPLKVRKDYEDSLLVFRGSQGVPKSPGAEGAEPYRKGKVVVLDSAMHMEPSIHSSFYGLSETIRAAHPDEMETVIIVHYVPAVGGGMGAPHRLFWGSFAWPSGRCLGFEQVKTWPRNYSRADIKKDYPDFTKKIKEMKAK